MVGQRAIQDKSFQIKERIIFNREKKKSELEFSPHFPFILTLLVISKCLQSANLLPAFGHLLLCINFAQYGQSQPLFFEIIDNGVYDEHIFTTGNNISPVNLQWYIITW